MLALVRPERGGSGGSARFEAGRNASPSRTSIGFLSPATSSKRPKSSSRSIIRSGGWAAEPGFIRRGSPMSRRPGSIETFSFDVEAPYTHEGWRGRIRASAGVAASLPKYGVRRFDRELGSLLDSRFPEDPLGVPHRVWAVVCSAPGEAA